MPGNMTIKYRSRIWRDMRTAREAAQAREGADPGRTDRLTEGIPVRQAQDTPVWERARLMAEMDTGSRKAAEEQRAGIRARPEDSRGKAARSRAAGAPAVPRGLEGPAALPGSEDRAAPPDWEGPAVLRGLEDQAGPPGLEGPEI